MPGQYFHMLRRQMVRKFRKPLVVMMPKSLLRVGLPGSASQLSELTDGEFQLVLDDPTQPDREKVKRVLFCSGKINFLLAAAREKENIKDTAIVRVEQLYPFPRKEIQAILSKYSKASEICWVQEEPMNRGAWTFIAPRLRELLRDTAVLTYHGREESASPATGSAKMHAIEEQEVIAHALDLPPKKDEPAPASVAAAVAVAGKETAQVAAADASPKQPATVSSPKQTKD
jgi:2-oxoglutarate dehydrogenase E1 component